MCSYSRPILKVSITRQVMLYFLCVVLTNRNPNFVVCEPTKQMKPLALYQTNACLKWPMSLKNKKRKEKSEA